MLLVSRSGFVEENTVEVFRHYGVKFQVLSEKIIMGQYSRFFSSIFMPLANLWFICLQGQFPILKTRSYPDLYPIIHHLKGSFPVGRGRILIPEFIRSLSALSVFEVTHCLSLDRNIKEKLF